MAKILSFLLKTCFLFFLVSCATVPVTGRQQLNLVPAQQLMSMSFQNYDDFLKKNKLSVDAEKSLLVRRTGKAVQQAVENYMRMIGRETVGGVSPRSSGNRSWAEEKKGRTAPRCRPPSPQVVCSVAGPNRGDFADGLVRASSRLGP